MKNNLRIEKLMEYKSDWKFVLILKLQSWAMFTSGFAKSVRSGRIEIVPLEWQEEKDDSTSSWMWRRSVRVRYSQIKVQSLTTCRVRQITIMKTVWLNCLKNITIFLWETSLKIQALFDSLVIMFNHIYVLIIIFKTKLCNYIYASIVILNGMPFFIGYNSEKHLLRLWKFRIFSLPNRLKIDELVHSAFLFTRQPLRLFHNIAN